MGVHGALPPRQGALLQRALGGDTEGVGPPHERKDAGDPHRSAHDPTGEAVHSLGPRTGALNPELSELGLRIRLEPECERTPGCRGQRDEREQPAHASCQGAVPIATPHGSSPAGICLMTFMESASTTLTSLDGPLAL